MSERPKSIPELVEKLKQDLAPDNPQDRALIAQITADAAQLALRGAAGEDVEYELRHVKAQALNLAQEKRNLLASNINSWLQTTIAMALSKALPSS